MPGVRSQPAIGAMNCSMVLALLPNWISPPSSSGCLGDLASAMLGQADASFSPGDRTPPPPHRLQMHSLES